ncbi:MAG: response regulator [Rhodoferax sp.]|nr:response regulator [Rhodoferax sp.]
MSPITVEKSFCTTREAAKLLGVSVGTVQMWVGTGLLQAWKTAGGHRRVLRDSVEHLLHKKTTPSAPSQTAAQTVSGPRHLRVLVVEDDASLLRLYQTQIARWPMPSDVTLFDNAINALLHMGRGGPDLLISDLHMPGMDGFGMLMALHKAPEMATTTVVVVTGLDQHEVKLRGGVPPGVVVLEKPIPFAKLLSIAQDTSTRLGIAQHAH